MYAVECIQNMTHICITCVYMIIYTQVQVKHARNKQCRRNSTININENGGLGGGRRQPCNRCSVHSIYMSMQTCISTQNQNNNRKVFSITAGSILVCNQQKYKRSWVRFNLINSIYIYKKIWHFPFQISPSFHPVASVFKCIAGLHLKYCTNQQYSHFHS